MPLLSDRTKFYNLSYGYALFKDDRSRILGLIGINGMDLKFAFEASGQITLNGENVISGEYEEEASIFVPLPLFGLEFSFSFTPKWAMNTKVSLVGGKYQDVRAAAMQTSINSIFKFTEHIGVMMGITYFSTEVVIEDADERQDIEYGYAGAYIGMHFKY